MIGLTSCRRNVNAVTTPKLPPPPRRAQSRSGFSAALTRSQLAVRRYDFRAHEVVAREPELAGDASDSTAQRQSRHAGVGDGADGRGESERERFAVELAEQRAAFDVRQPGKRIDLHGPHGREVDDQPAVAAGLPRQTVAAAAYRGQQAVCGAEAHRAPDVRRTDAAHDEGRLAIEGRIPQPARGIIAGQLGSDRSSPRSPARRSWTSADLRVSCRPSSSTAVMSASLAAGNARR